MRAPPAFLLGAMAGVLDAGLVPLAGLHRPDARSAGLALRLVASLARTVPDSRRFGVSNMGVGPTNKTAAAGGQRQQQLRRLRRRVVVVVVVAGSSSSSSSSKSAIDGKGNKSIAAVVGGPYEAGGLTSVSPLRWAVASVPPLCRRARALLSGGHGQQQGQLRPSTVDDRATDALPSVMRSSDADAASAPAP